MVKFTNTDLIKALETGHSKKIFGEIDIEFLNSNIIESLYYSLPLIERMVVEIYKIVPQIDVECIQQGTMRTVKELLEKYPDILPESTNFKIIDLFKEDGIRNKIMHVKDEVFTINVNFEEVNFIIMSLLSSFNSLYAENLDVKFSKIEYL